MTELKIDPKVATFVAEAGFQISPRADGGVKVEEYDIEFVVSGEQGVWIVEMFERGASNGVRLATREDRVLQMYLVLRFGDSWRTAHGLGYILPSAIPVGYAVVEERQHVFTVRGPHGDRLAWDLERFDAHDLAVALGYRVEEVIAAYEHRIGAPVFTRSLRSRLWRRRGRGKV